MKKAKSKKNTALLLLLAIVSTLVILFYINNKTTLTYSFITDGKNKLAVTGEVSAVSQSRSTVYYVEDLLIEVQAENIRAKNIKGDVAWSCKMPEKTVGISNAGENIIIIDLSNNIHYYSLKGKLLWTYKSDHDIIDIFTEDNGSFLVEYKGITGSHAEAFRHDGSKIGSILVDNAHILSFSEGSDAFSISIVDTSSEFIKTKIITYSFKGNILWANNFDNTIISKLRYSRNNKLLAIGENTVYIYNNDGSLHHEVKIDGEISSVSMSDRIVAMTLQDKGKQYLVCYDTNMREQSRVEIRPVPLGIYPQKSNLLVYYNDELMILTSKGELNARYEPNTDISNAYMTSDNKVYITSNRRLQQLEYVR
ncbi:MAG: hypothetical protein GX301_00275 [Gracilibacteraceae bacterium]|nr:hypothetical protein [Gracilibacteraceae bacterium]